MDLTNEDPQFNSPSEVATWKFGYQLSGALYYEAHSPGHSQGGETFVKLIERLNNANADELDTLIEEISEKNVVRIFNIIATKDFIQFLPLVYNHAHIPKTGPDSPIIRQSLKTAIRVGSLNVLNFYFENNVPILTVPAKSNDEKNGNANAGSKDEGIAGLRSLLFTVLKANEIGMTKSKNQHSMQLALTFWDYIAKTLYESNYFQDLIDSEMKEETENETRNEKESNQNTVDNETNCSIQKRSSIKDRNEMFTNLNAALKNASSSNVNESGNNNKVDNVSRKNKNDSIDNNEDNNENKNENKDSNVNNSNMENVRKMRFLKAMALNPVILQMIMKFVTNFQMSNKFYPKRLLATIKFLREHYLLFEIEKNNKVNKFWNDILFRLIDDYLELKRFLKNGLYLIEKNENFYKILCSNNNFLTKEELKLVEKYFKLNHSKLYTSSSSDIYPSIAMIHANDMESASKAITNDNNDNNGNNDTNNDEKAKLRVSWHGTIMGNDSIVMMNDINQCLLDTIDYLIGGGASIGLVHQNALKLYSSLLDSLLIELRSVQGAFMQDQSKVFSTLTRAFTDMKKHESLTFESPTIASNKYNDWMTILTTRQQELAALMRTIANGKNDWQMRQWIGNKQSMLISDALSINMTAQEAIKYQLPRSICDLILSYITL